MNHKKRLVLILFHLILFLGCQKKTEIPTQTPEQILQSFEIADGFKLELFVSEPLIADPVAMEIDEYGRLYVVQLHGYPLDKGQTGSVKIILDSDGDGRPDKAVTFADNLTMPNGIMRWKKGVIVTDAPNVLYLEDSDGDHVADIRDTLLTGFALSNPQHKVNTPIYGLDNWIYLGNEPATTPKIFVDEFGDKGEEIRYPKLSNSPSLPRNANGRRVRFKPDDHQIEMLASATQYSNAQDRWGRHFLGNNTNHIFHEVIHGKYLQRNPFLDVVSATQTISSYGMPADVFPITENPDYQIFTSIGVFTSACGVTFYDGNLFPSSFESVAFVAEPVSNIVHACVVESYGPTFRANRVYDQKEFLASRDPWFRPVNHYIGPDGALYIVDYHRRYIEHPEWMGEDVINSGALYDGSDRGRIFRLTPTNALVANWLNNLQLGDAGNHELISLLGHPNKWYRKTAQRLLVHRKDASLREDLIKFACEDTTGFGRLHAAWTLEGMGIPSKEVIILLLRDPIPGNRENGITMAESLLKSHPELIKELLKLKRDPDARVRFQLVCTLGELNSPEANNTIEELLFADLQDNWFQIAALSSRNLDYKKLLNKLINSPQNSDRAVLTLIERLSGLIGINNIESDINFLITKAIENRGKNNVAWQASILNGLAGRARSINFNLKSIEKIKENLVATAFSHGSGDVRSASLNLLEIIGLPDAEHLRTYEHEALNRLQNKGSADADKLVSVRFLALSNPTRYKDTLYGLLSVDQSIDVQKTSLRLVSEIDSGQIGRYLVDHWSEFSPQLRDTGIAIFLKNETNIRTLLSALEEKNIDISSINFYQQISLMMNEKEEIRKRARKIFSNTPIDKSRKEVISKYRSGLGKPGNPAQGEAVFRNNCSTCHQIGGKKGTDFGPDLSTIRNRRLESILTDILDPALSIADGYELWEIQLQNGETKQGIIASETPSSIVLKIYGLDSETINRQEIQSVRALGITLMPVGLENTISVEEMNDLLAFITKPL